MSSHPLKRNNTTHSNTTTHHANTSTNTTTTPPNRSSAPRYDSLSHSDDNPNISDEYEDETYSDALSGGYDEYDDLNSEAQEYYNSGASELVTTVRSVLSVFYILCWHTLVSLCTIVSLTQLHISNSICNYQQGRWIWWRRRWRRTRWSNTPRRVQIFAPITQLRTWWIRSMACLCCPTTFLQPWSMVDNW